MPAARTFQLLGLITLLLVASFLDARLAWAALALDVLVVAAAVVDWRLAAATPLTAARRWPPLLVQGAPGEVEVRARVAFEVSRRHRYAREMSSIPEGVTVHVLPTGGGSARDDSPLTYRDLRSAMRRITQAHAASDAYLHALPVRGNR